MAYYLRISYFYPYFNYILVLSALNSAILNDIRDNLPRFSKSERKVADWLLTNARLAIDTPLSAVASGATVSEPTVVRFCRKMGMSGFRELKTHLIAALQKPQSYVHHDVSQADDATSAAIKVLESSVQTLVDLRASIAHMPFDAAVSTMMDARQLIFVGLGASGHVASDACHKFFRLGIPCSASLDTQTILQQAAIASPRDVYLTISHSGSWPLLIRGMQLAQQRGATIIALTHPSSELAGVATYTFDCVPAEDTNAFTPMSSRLAHLTLLDALQVTLAIKLGGTAENNLQLTKAALAIP